ncbi:centrosomal protein of 44 kDa isoform X2 [Mixophyes fleayi]|uniref:centrosomal protein of 44 kDa isoform X2 n=1 Tax=Mixophyes fleayi TaxID=3061075 RepID=UPI003F4D9179
MTTGDVKGVVRKMEQRLRLLNYPRDVDYSGLVKGDPAASLPIISYTFTCYSTYIAEILASLDIELAGKSDLRFIDAVYKVLRDVFHYKPVLSKQQFLQCAFSERKIQTVCDIIDCVVKKHKEIASQNKKNSLVERHTSSNLHCPSLPTAELFVSRTVSPKEGEVYMSDSEAENQSENVVTKDVQIELLKAQVAECQEKIARLDWMEDRLQALETSTKGKIIIDETDWNNLLSRVLLLETDRLLQHKQRDLTCEFTTISEDCPSSRMTNEDLNVKADISENNHQSSGYTSLLSPDTSPIAIDINYRNFTEDSTETTRQRMDRLTKMLEETSTLLKFSNTS